MEGETLANGGERKLTRNNTLLCWAPFVGYTYSLYKLAKISSWREGKFEIEVDNGRLMDKVSTKVLVNTV